MRILAALIALVMCCTMAVAGGDVGEVCGGDFLVKDCSAGLFCEIGKDREARRNVIVKATRRLAANDNWQGVPR